MLSHSAGGKARSDVHNCGQQEIRVRSAWPQGGRVEYKEQREDVKVKSLPR